MDEVADVLFSNVDKLDHDDETPVRLCNYVDVYNNQRITSTIDFMDATAAPREIAKFQIRKNDVISTKDSETPDDIAVTAIVSEDLPNVLCGYHLALIRPRSRQLHAPFLAWLHTSKQFRGQYEAQAVGVTRFGLPQYAFRAARIPLPPRNEQERIAAYLDEKCAAIDAAVAAKRRQIGTLEDLSASIINDAVTRGIKPGVPLCAVDEDWISEAPAHWDVCRIKRIVSRVDYGISESTERDGRFPVLKMGNIQSGEIVLKDIEYVDAVEQDLLLEQGDVLYNRTNSPDQVGKAAVYRGSETDGYTFASYLVRLRTNHRADPYYLTYLLNSSGFLTFARKMAIPSVQQSNLNSTRYCRMWVPLPPRPEQAAIRAFLDEQTRAVRLAVANIESQIATLTAYRKSLIHECVTGQRRV